MTDAWYFSEDDLMSVEEIIANPPVLEIEKAEVREIGDPFGSGQHGEQKNK